MKSTKADTILRITQQIASTSTDFFKVKGPGIGDRANHEFMNKLNKKLVKALGKDYSNKKICGEINSEVDFYIPEEKTIIEIALSLKSPSSEFHKDLFKALLAKETGHKVSRLIFIAKQGAEKRHREPASKAIIKWLKKYHKISIKIKDLADKTLLNKKKSLRLFI